MLEEWQDKQKRLTYMYVQGRRLAETKAKHESTLAKMKANLIKLGGK